MASLERSVLPIRAVIFDMDGLLINTEDLYFTCMDSILAKYNKPPVPWSLRPKLMGVPSAVADAKVYAWASLPISRAAFDEEGRLQRIAHYRNCELLPGAKRILEDLQNANGRDGRRIEVAMASSSTRFQYELKVSRPEIRHAFSKVFNDNNRILGDDPALKVGRGKPAPDIYLLALDAINSKLEEKIKPEECLVLEDSVPGVEAGRRAGMRVVWIPHPELRTEYHGREAEVLAGRTRMRELDDGAISQLGEIGNHYPHCLESLVDFPYDAYGIVVRR